jgi:hypothetical protein
VPDLTLLPAARASTSGSPRGRELFLRALARHGVPGDVARYLLGEDATPVPPSLPPAVAPRAEWLIAFDAQRWLVGVRTLPKWRRWLLEGVRELLAANRLTANTVLAAGAAARDLDLLRLAAAPAEVISLADPAGGSVQLPPSGVWPLAANHLLADLLSAGTLFPRLAPNTDGERLLGWLAGLTTKEDDVFAQVARFRRALREGEAASRRWLDWTASYLSRRTVLQQVAAWAAVRHEGPDRTLTLRLLLNSHRLTPGEKGWLTARTLECIPLPALPPWTAEDMVALFPLLDPVRDVVRVVLSRSEPEPGEEALLERVRAAISHSPPEPPGTLPASALRHPSWVKALVAVPGWSGCFDPDARLKLIRQLCRELHNAAETEAVGDAELRNAIRIMAR